MNIDAVKNIQTKQGLTNQQFADKLGIEVGSWYRIKSGRAPLNDKFLVRVHRAFPELGIFLFTGVTGAATTKGNSSLTLSGGVALDNPQNTDEKLHKPILTRLKGWVRKLLRKEK